MIVRLEWNYLYFVLTSGTYT